MKYILMEDFASFEKGMIIDEKDKLEMLLLVGKEFYKANPKQFQPLEDIDDTPRG